MNTYKIFHARNLPYIDTENVFTWTFNIQVFWYKMLRDRVLKLTFLPYSQLPPYY